MIAIFFLGLLLGVMVGVLLERFVLEPLAAELTRGERE